MINPSLPCGFENPYDMSGCEQGSPVLVALSGGADSSALLHMMCEFGKRYNAKIYAAHVNHMIRGEEADRDENFCKDMAEQLGVELFLCKKDVPEYAKQKKLSIETAARNIRYEFFDSLMEKYDIPLLVTAHNANDNLETMIFNLARGCGLGGMCGIAKTRRCNYGNVVRPILSMTRDEILEYCHTNGIAFVCDSTNTDTDYTRNKIRAQIIPILQEINSGAVKNSVGVSDSLRRDELCLTSMTDMFLEQLSDDMSMEIEKITGSPTAISSRAIMAMYKETASGTELQRTHIESILALCSAGVAHSSVSLPGPFQAVIENGRLSFTQSKDRPKKSEEFCVELTDGVTVIPQICAHIVTGNSQTSINVYKKSILLYFDSDKICGSLIARDRRAGDKIRIGGINRSVKKLMCDKKIPLDIRYRLPVICDGEEIVAIPMIGVCDKAKTKDTQKANKIQFYMI